MLNFQFINVYDVRYSPADWSNWMLDHAISMYFLPKGQDDNKNSNDNKLGHN